MKYILLKHFFLFQDITVVFPYDTFMSKKDIHASHSLFIKMIFRTCWYMFAQFWKMKFVWTYVKCVLHRQKRFFLLRFSRRWRNRTRLRQPMPRTEWACTVSMYLHVCNAPRSNELVKLIYLMPKLLFLMSFNVFSDPKNFDRKTTRDNKISKITSATDHGAKN